MHGGDDSGKRVIDGQRLSNITVERSRLKAELGKNGSQLTIGADALKLAVTMIRDLPRLYAKSGPDVRGAITDALFTKLYIDEDRLTEAVYRPEFGEIVEAYEAQNAPSVAFSIQCPRDRGK